MSPQDQNEATRQEAHDRYLEDIAGTRRLTENSAWAVELALSTVERK